MVKKLEHDLEEAKQGQKDKQQLYQECVSKVKLLEKNSFKEHTNKREARLKDLDKKIKTTRSQMQSASKDLKASLFNGTSVAILFCHSCDFVMVYYSRDMKMKEKGLLWKRKQ